MIDVGPDYTCPKYGTPRFAGRFLILASCLCFTVKFAHPAPAQQSSNGQEPVVNMQDTLPPSDSVGNLVTEYDDMERNASPQQSGQPPAAVANDPSTTSDNEPDDDTETNPSPAQSSGYKALPYATPQDEATAGYRALPQDDDNETDERNTQSTGQPPARAGNDPLATLINQQADDTQTDPPAGGNASPQATPPAEPDNDPVDDLLDEQEQQQAAQQAKAAELEAQQAAAAQAAAAQAAAAQAAAAQQQAAQAEQQPQQPSDDNSGLNTALGFLGQAVVQSLGNQVPVPPAIGTAPTPSGGGSGQDYCGELAKITAGPIPSDPLECLKALSQM